MREIEVVLDDDADALNGELWYRPTRVSHQTAARWGELFGELLQAVSAGPLDRPVESIVAECEHNLSLRSQNHFVR